MMTGPLSGNFYQTIRDWFFFKNYLIMYSVSIMWQPELREDSEIVAIIKIAKRKEQKAKEK